MDLNGRIWTVAGMLMENKQAVPGPDVAPHGFIVFASNYCGDAYCFDTQNLSREGQPRIVLISHEVDHSDKSREEILQRARLVAEDLLEFLQKFYNAELEELP